MRWLAVAACGMFLALVVGGASAGTEKSPEITDPTADTNFAMAPGCAVVACAESRGLDLVNGWISGETATEFHIFVEVASGNPGGAGVYDASFDAHFGIGDKQYTAGATRGASETDFSPSGATSAVAVTSDGYLDMTVPRSSIGTPAMGSKLTSFYIQATGDPQGAPTGPISDRAPDDPGFGKDYTFTQGPAAAPSGGGNTPTTSKAPLNATTKPSTSTSAPASTSTSATSASTTAASSTTSAAPTTTATTAKKSPAVPLLGVLVAAVGCVALRRRL